MRDRGCADRAREDDSSRAQCADEFHSGDEDRCAEGPWGKAEGPQDLPPWFR